MLIKAFLHGLVVIRADLQRCIGPDFPRKCGQFNSFGGTVCTCPRDYGDLPANNLNHSFNDLFMLFVT